MLLGTFHQFSKDIPQRCLLSMRTSQTFNLVFGSSVKDLQCQHLIDDEGLKLQAVLHSKPLNLVSNRRQNRNHSGTCHSLSHLFRLKLDGVSILKNK